MTARPHGGPADGDGLGQWVRRWRHVNRWTQERLAEALGYDVSYVAKIERGSRPPTPQFVARLAEVAAAPMEELLGLSRQPSERLRLPLPGLALRGRDDDVVEVSELLRTGSGCVTLVGAPGIGKTSLALEVAWQVAADFRHGACFVPLAEVARADEVAMSVLHHLGLGDQDGRLPADVIVAALGDQSLLLVLDNFEHVLPASVLVERLVAATPHVRVLATSREALGVPGETVYPVTTLGFPDPLSDKLDDAEEYAAVRVFVDRSRLARPNFALTEANRRPVVEICARLDGLPLAINLTAAASHLLSPSDIARSLRDRLELPTDRGDDRAVGLRSVGGTGYGRLGSALDWSWQLLDEQSRSLLARLGVFAGGCSLAATEAVCADPDDDVLRGLAGLEAKSLLQAVQTAEGESRFTCLETVRRYALGRLAERGELDHLRRRHCAYFVGLARSAEPRITGHRDQVRWLRLLDQEYPNLAAAFSWALDHDPAAALAMASALPRFFSRRRLSEGRQWLTVALEQVGTSSAVAARALTGLGVLARLQGDLDAATAALERARAMAAELEATKEQAAATLALGIVAEDRGDYDTAESRFEEATALAAGAGDDRGAGHGLNALGVIALRHQLTGLATERFMSALGRFRALDDPWSVAVSATNLGWIAETGGELAEATVWYEESRQLRGLVGDEHGLARSAADLGRVARLRRNFKEARPQMEEALHAFQRLGDRRLAAACLLELADVAFERGRRDIAARLVGAAQAIRDALGTPAWPDEDLLEAHVLAELAATMGKPAMERARLVGRSLGLEDAVDMVDSDSWPAAYRGARLAP
ncbi:MAG: hypothetical protein QOE93_62 [Actinomycetota bacterium]|nr:hypothetical protein [Actinomycetota bacterium]